MTDEQEQQILEETDQETDAATAEAEAQIKSEQAQEDEFSKGFGNVDDIKIDDIVLSDEEAESEGSSNSSEDEESSGTTEASDDANTNEEEASAEDSNNDDDSGGTESESEEDTTSEQQASDTEDYNEEEAYEALSEETGVQVSSDEDVVSALSELGLLRKNGSESNLSEAIKAAIVVEKAGGNLSEHFARVGMDFEKMDEKEVLRQQSFKDNAKLYGTNPKLAQAKFERDFNQKYGKWTSYQALTDADEKEDFLRDNDLTAEDIEYEKMMFSNDATVAKGDMIAWKEEVKPKVAETNSPVFTEKEAADYAVAYEAQAEESLGKFKATSIQMGKGLKDFALGLNDTTKPIVEAWVKNPSTFLQDIGFDGKDINTDKLLPIMTLISEASNGNLGGRIAKFAVDSENVETIKKTIDKPNGKTSPDAPQDRQGGDDWDKIGEAAERANAEETNRGR